MKNFIIALVLIPFFFLSVILPYFYVEALRLKIQNPDSKNLDTEGFVWLGIVLTVFLILDVFIIRLFIKKCREGRGNPLTNHVHSH